MGGGEAAAIGKTEHCCKPTLSWEGDGLCRKAFAAGRLAPIGAAAVKPRPPPHHAAPSTAGLHSGTRTPQQAAANLIQRRGNGVWCKGRDWHKN